VSIVLHIERLVIDEAVLGGERGDDVRVALQRELARWLAAPGAREALAGAGAVDALPSLWLAPTGQGSGPLGARIAAAVGEGLGIDAGAGRPLAARVRQGHRIGNDARSAR
jgi:hypothetical protein